MPNALVIGPEEIAALEQLRALADKHPVDMRALMPKLETRHGKREHMQQMTRQSVRIPLAYLVTFSIETNHPIGTCRHMSMSSDTPGRVPNHAAVWMVGEHLGFVREGGNRVAVWLEKLERGEGATDAVNLVQPI